MTPAASVRKQFSLLISILAFCSTLVVMPEPSLRAQTASAASGDPRAKFPRLDPSFAKAIPTSSALTARYRFSARGWTPNGVPAVLRGAFTASFEPTAVNGFNFAGVESLVFQLNGIPWQTYNTQIVVRNGQLQGEGGYSAQFVLGASAGNGAEDLAIGNNDFRLSFTDSGGMIQGAAFDFCLPDGNTAFVATSVTVERASAAPILTGRYGFTASGFGVGAPAATVSGSFTATFLYTGGNGQNGWVPAILEEIQVPLPGSPHSVANVDLNVRNVSLQSDGRYSVRFELGGRYDAYGGGSFTDDFRLQFTDFGDGTLVGAQFEYTTSGSANFYPAGTVTVTRLATPVLSRPRIGVAKVPGAGLWSGITRVDLGAVSLGDFPSQTLRITNAGMAAITGIRLSIVGPNASEFRVTQPAATLAGFGSETSVNISLQATGQGTKSATLRIHGNDLLAAPFEVPLHAVVGLPDISVEIPSGSEVASGHAVAFGVLTVGRTKQETVTIRNTGNRLLNLGAVGLLAGSDSAFQLTAPPGLAPLEVGQSRVLTVRWTPTTDGNASATLRFQSDDPDEGITDVIFTGQAVLNQPPVVTQPLSDVSIVYGDGVSIFVSPQVFSEPDPGQELTLSVEGLPAGVLFRTENRTLGGDPERAGEYSVTVRATDNGSGNLSAADTFLLRVLPRPTVVPRVDRIRAVDGNGLPLPPPIVFEEGVRVEYRTTATTESPVGDYTITPVVVDIDGFAANRAFTLNEGVYRITGPNHPPQISVMFPTNGLVVRATSGTFGGVFHLLKPNLEVTDDQGLYPGVAIRDLANGGLVIGGVPLIASEGGSTLVGALSQTYSESPQTALGVGVHRLVFVTRDIHGATNASAPLEVTVLPATANRPIPNQRALMGLAYNYTPPADTFLPGGLASAGGGPVLTAVGLPPGLEMDPVNGRIHGSATAVGTFQVQVRLDTGGSFLRVVVEDDFEFTVEARPAAGPDVAVYHPIDGLVVRAMDAPFSSCGYLFTNLTVEARSSAGVLVAGTVRVEGLPGILGNIPVPSPLSDSDAAGFFGNKPTILTLTNVIAFLPVGTWTLRVEAQDIFGRVGSSTNLQVTVLPAPPVRPVPDRTWLAGVEFRQVLTNADFFLGGNPANAVFEASGLPSGYQIDPVTGTLAGTSNDVGEFDVVVRGTGGSAPFLRVVEDAFRLRLLGSNPAPVVTLEWPTNGLTLRATNGMFGVMGVQFTNMTTTARSPFGLRFSGTVGWDGFLGVPSFAFGNFFGPITIPQETSVQWMGTRPLETITTNISGFLPPGTHRLVARAMDIFGVIGYSDPVEVTVLPALPVVPMADRSGVVGFAFDQPLGTGTFFVEPGPTGTVYTATGLPEGLSIAAATGRITGTPTQAGISTVRIRGVGGSAPYFWVVEDDLQLTILDQNPPAEIVVEGWTDGQAIRGSINDFEGPLVYASNPIRLRTTAPTGIRSFTATGHFGRFLNRNYGTPAGSPPFPYSVVEDTSLDAFPLGPGILTLTVVDGSGQTTIRVVPFEVLPPLVQTALPDQEGVRGSPFSLVVPASHFDQPRISTLGWMYSASGLPPGLQFDPVTRTLSGTPTSVGTNRITITATSPRMFAEYRMALATEFLFRVEGDPGTPVVLAEPPPAVQRYGRGVQVTLPTTLFTPPPPTYVRTFVATGLPPGVSFDPATLRLSGTPTEAGTWVVTITAIDTLVDDGAAQGLARPWGMRAKADTGGTASVSLTIEVPPMPLFVQPADVSRRQGEPNPALTGVVSGLRLNDPISVAYSTAANQDSPPGDYPITATLQDPESRLGNYAVTVRTGTLRILAHQPPVAGTDQVLRRRGTAVRIPVANLLANDVVDVGLARTFLGVQDFPTDAEATVSLSGGTLLYTPPPDFSGIDRFTYQIGDGSGGLATGWVEVRVAQDGEAQAPNLIEASPVSEGIRLRYAVIPGRNYIVQSATSLVSPVEWTDQSSVLTGKESGTVEFTDSNPTSPRFYRLVLR